MEVNLSLLKGKEKSTLYFIGNGFDIFHGVKSKYIHFYSWLNLQDEEHEQFASDMEEIFSTTSIHGNWLWRDFEEALGLLDVDDVHNRFSGKEDNEFYDEGYQKRASQHIYAITSKIPGYLKEWVKYINNSEIQQKLSLSPECLYLTFNYTLLLENVYGIPKDHILHIHNSINDAKPLVTGHKVYFREKYNDNDSLNVERSKQHIIQEANNLRKPVDKLIEENSSFFTNLADIKNIVVFGHSLSKIDRQYFTEVIKHVHDDTHWYFVVRDNDNEAKARFEKLINYYSGEDQYLPKIKHDNCKYIEIHN